MLKRSCNIAAAVISIRGEKKITGTNSSSEKNCEQKVNTEGVFEGHEDFSLKPTDLESKLNTCKSICMKSDINESSAGEIQATNNIILEQDIKPNQLSIPLKDSREDNHCNTGSQEISKKSFYNMDIDFQQRKRILEEKAEASLRIIGKM